MNDKEDFQYGSKPESRQGLEQDFRRRLYRGKSHRRHDDGRYSLYAGHHGGGYFTHQRPAKEHQGK